MKKKEEKKIEIPEVVVNENSIQKNDFREHVIYARVSKTLYGRVYFASQHTRASMSLISSMCIEKALEEVEREIIRKGIRK